jgi:hypothetical protein
MHARHAAVWLDQKEVRTFLVVDPQDEGFAPSVAATAATP